MNWTISKLEAYHLPERVQGEPVYCLDDIRHKGSANLIQALVWNVGTCRPDDKGEIQEEETTRMRVRCGARRRTNV